LRELADTGGATSEPLVPGATLDRFVVRRMLGRGGMGVVYEARDERLGRDVAIKLLDSRHVDRPERRKRFAREARAAAAVTHPNVARVLEVGDGDTGTYLVFELVPGPTLRALLAEGPLPVARCAEIGAALAAALAAAHEAGVVHRDLKPENVIVEGGITPKILDFGLAKVSVPEGSGSGSDVVTVEGHVLGSPGYMSPEQALGKPCGPASDVFSLGVVLFELLTGRRPFSGVTAMEAIVATTRDDAPDARDLRPDLPQAFAHIVASCLAKDPDARPTAKELEARLSAPLDAPERGETVEISGSRVTPFEATVVSEAPAVRAFRAPVAAAAILGFVLVGGLAMRARPAASTGAALAPMASEAPPAATSATSPLEPKTERPAPTEVSGSALPPALTASALPAAPKPERPVGPSKPTNVQIAQSSRPAASTSPPVASVSPAGPGPLAAQPAPTSTLAAPSFSERK
jgi:serine/threonine-protein kinase